jgi:aspartyl-tRNA(Asn)/glutamyl-tRNA(Gln) amidotransferase subunit C
MPTDVPVMQVDQEVVLTVAELTQLNIDAQDIDSYAADMTKVLALVAQMQSVDTTGIEPMSNPLDAVQRLRPDEVTEINQRDAFQKLAPETDAGFYLVPRVVE